MRSWLTGRPSTSSSSLSTGPDEPQALENALIAASHLMNDDIDTAEKELAQGNSSFHYLGLGLVGFMRAILGFEKDMMADASKRLNEAESRAADGYRSASKHQDQAQSSIYAPGSEYLLCQAQTQIMGAVMGVLTESVTESIKGFYKLRKAYLTLDSLLQQENNYLEKHRSSNNNQLSPAQDEQKDLSDLSESASSPDDSDSEVDEFYDVAEDPEEIPDVIDSMSRSSTVIADDMEKLTIRGSAPTAMPRPRRLSSQMQEGPDAEIFKDFVDAFIHSSACMCYGLLLLLLSLLPPAFSTLSKIAGFRGDRKRGIALLWQASKFSNLNGAFAGLILLGYYNGFIGFCDILPREGSGSFPKERCVELLQTSTKRFPNSCMWKLEQCRMLANEKNLAGALEMLEQMPTSNLLQLRALHCFEKAMTYLFLHRYKECSEHFQKMVELNNWSHGLYYYISACCQIELYRQAVDTNPKQAKEYSKEVERLLKIVPNHIGKKKIMARQLPFDVFVQRKLDKWHQRAKDHSLSLADAAGVSPVCEMIYFWNGYKKMNVEQLELCHTRLDWSTTNGRVPWDNEAVDEKGIHSLLIAVVLRNLGRTAKARIVLQKNVVDEPHTLFKGNYRDNWTPPAARYEMAATYWMDYLEVGDGKELVQSQQLLDTAANWEAYDLDVRVGLRVKTGLETIRRQRDVTSQ